MELELATILAEFDAKGVQVPVVSLVVRRPADWRWVGSAVPWLEARGRRVLVRTRQVAPSAVVEVLARSSALIMLEVVSSQPGLQSALLGPEAASCPALLVHAQHLKANGIEVAAWVGPLLPRIHDTSAGTRSLWQHIAAADIRHGHASVGMLTSTRLDGLSRILSEHELQAVRRAFQPRHGVLELNPAREVMPPRREVAELLEMSARDDAAAAGVELDGCGCSALCHRSTVETAYVSMATAELFPQAS